MGTCKPRIAIVGDRHGGSQNIRAGGDEPVALLHEIDRCGLRWVNECGTSQHPSQPRGRYDKRHVSLQSHSSIGRKSEQPASSCAGVAAPLVIQFLTCKRRVKSTPTPAK